ncbi:MAG: NAD(P)H-dependent oxidoreductase [Ancalomicrobiaceae bacterium]|nr:NAD(P)H-dependent oxidoreductase [Ancalomicrobiaceae bacterium]
MAGKYTLVGISGSLRRDSYSTAILRTLAEAIAEQATTVIADIGSIPHYNADLDTDDAPAPVRLLKQQIARADGLIVVSAEFNHGIPGVLKNAIDWASRPVFKSPLRDKPVLIVTESPAFTGGVRAQYQLRETLVSTLARPVPTPEIVIGAVQTKVAGGRLTDRAAIDFAVAAIDVLFHEIDQLHAALTA